MTFIYVPLVVYILAGITLIFSAGMQRAQQEVTAAETNYVSDLKNYSGSITSILSVLSKNSESVLAGLPATAVRQMNLSSGDSAEQIQTLFQTSAEREIRNTSGLKMIRLIAHPLTLNQVILEYPLTETLAGLHIPNRRRGKEFSVDTAIAPDPDLVFSRWIGNDLLAEFIWDPSVLLQEEMISYRNSFDGLWLFSSNADDLPKLPIVHMAPSIELTDQAIVTGINRARTESTRPLATLLTSDQTPYQVAYLRLPESDLGLAALKRKDRVLSSVVKNTALFCGILSIVLLIGFTITFWILKRVFDSIQRRSHQTETQLETVKSELTLAAVSRDFYMDNLSDMVTHHERDGRLIHASSSALDLFPFDSETSDDLDFFSCVHPEDLSDVVDFWHRLDLSGPNPRMQFRMINREKDICWIESVFKPIFDNVLPGEVLCLSRNITHYILTEQALSESEFRYRSVLELAPMGIFQSTIDGEILFVNPSMATMLGYDSPRELMSTISDHGIENVLFAKPEENQSIMKLLRESVKEWQRFDVELKRKNKGRFSSVLSMVAEPSLQNHELEVFGFLEEAEVSRSVRSELQLSENRFRRLFSESPFAMILLDKNLELQDYNDSFRKLLGLQSDAMLETEYFHKDPNFQLIHNTLLSTRDSAGLSFQYDFDAIHQNAIFDTVRKEPLDLEVTIIRLQNRSEDAPQSGYAVLLQDVTEKKQIQNQLIQAQKMEAVGRLAGGVAHDFNNLLQVVIGYGEIIEQDLTDEESLENLQYMMEASQRGMILVRQLLAFSRREELKLQPLDMNDLIVNLLKMLRRLIGEHITLDFKKKSDLPFVHADPGQLEQVIMNLCVNSRDAMPDGGKLTLATHLVEPSANWSELHTTIPENTYVVVSVSDDGPGIPADIQYRVFEPFFTTKKADSGTGLGLATVYSVVKRHKGYLMLDSEPGHGASFSVYLPLSEPTETEDPTDQALTAGPAETTQGVILLAEDEERVRGLLCNILETAGYTVITANNGMEAVTQFHLNSHRIDLLMLDVIMPGMNGKDVYDFIALSNPEIPVLFSSGYSHDLLQNDYMLKIPGKLIQKPYQRQELLRTVKELITCRN